MKIIVLGDTHRYTSSIDAIKDVLTKADLVIHTGDNYDDMLYIQRKYNKNTIGVKGNCDWNIEAIRERLEVINNKRIYIVHGHKHGVKNGLSGIFYKGKEMNADLVIFGHSHMSFYCQEEGMIILNPGSLSLPRGNATKSYAVVEIGDTIKVEIVELGDYDKSI